MKQTTAILLAAYNGEKYLKEQLDSIVGQTFTDWALFINDDGSTDSTPEILRQYQNMYPDQIFLSENTSGTHGATGNFADLFAKVSGYEYYAFCDQDDRWEPEKLSEMIHFLKNCQKKYDGPLLAYCTLRITDQDMNPICDSLETYTHAALGQKQHYRKLLLANYVPGCAMVFNDKLKDLVSSYPKEIDLHDWWILLLCAAFGRIVRKNDTPLSNYRQHSCNTLGVTNTRSTLYRILDNLRPSVFRKHLRSLTNCRRQAAAQTQTLLQVYGDRLSPEQRRLAQNVLALLRSGNRLKSVILGMKYPYLGNTLYERFTFWWFTIPKENR